MKPSVPFFIFFPFFFFIFFISYFNFFMNYQRPLLWRIFYSLLLSEDFLRIFSFDKTRREERGHQGCQKKKYIGRGPRERIRPRSLVSSANNNNNNNKKQTAFQIFSKKRKCAYVLRTIVYSLHLHLCISLPSSYLFFIYRVDNRWKMTGK